MDLENRAYILYVVTQRWYAAWPCSYLSKSELTSSCSYYARLAIRLDVMGAILILVVALLVAIGPSNSPAQVGLLLTYTVSLVQMFGMLTRQAAEGTWCSFHHLVPLKLTSFLFHSREQHELVSIRPRSPRLLDTELLLGFTARRGSLTTATETVSHKASLAFSRSLATNLLTSPTFPFSFLQRPRTNDPTPNLLQTGRSQAPSLLRTHSCRTDLGCRRS